MNEVLLNSAEGISSGMNQIMDKIMSTVDQLMEIFEGSMDVISRYGVKTAKKIKDLWLKFMKTMWFVDQDLFQLLYIKNHLNDIWQAVEVDDPKMQKNTWILLSSLTEIRDLLVQRFYSDNYFHTNFLYFFENDINPVIEKITNKVVIS